MTDTGDALRVALFTGAYNYIRDGISLTLNRLVEHLERHEIPVVVFAPTARTPAFPSAGELVSVPSIPIPGRPEYRFAAGLSRAARRQLDLFQPTLCHIAVPDFLGFQALRFATRMNIPAVASYHTRYDTYFKYYGVGPLEDAWRKYIRWFYRQCAHVYAPSQSMADILMNENLASDVRIWSRGVDRNRFNPRKRNMHWRQRLQITDEEIVVSYVGRFVKEKNVAMLVDIFKALTYNNKNVRGVLIGNGPEEHALRIALPNVVFPGFLHGEELATAYASSDIFVFPSESETFGNVTLEAMASGLPCVCTDASGSKSLVDHGVTGFLPGVGRVDEFIGYLQQLIVNEPLRQDMAKKALERCSLYDWDKAMSELVDNYRCVISTLSSSSATHCRQA